MTNMPQPHDQVTPEKESAATKKKQVTGMFDRIAPYYDFLNHFLSLGIDNLWRRKAIKKLAELAPKKVLDVATGTGDLAVEAYRQLKPEKIIAFDISTKMLEFADKKIIKKGLQDIISTRHGDSENLPFKDNSFDAITVAFGVRNFENLEKGLEEMYRVLNTGGKVIILEFTKPRLFPFKQLFNLYFKYILPTIGKLTSKDPRAYKYLYESVQAFPDYDRFIEILEKTGFKNNSWQSLSLGICSIYQGSK
jgi:demethylmenaquinone methyltransferase/2-methoxy-6-polyprenyl-1,4-benzoquinol methylase